MQWLSLLKTLIALLPLLVQAIQALETAIPGSGHGAAKLAALRAILEGAWRAGTDVVGTFEEAWPAIERAVAGVVAAFNSVGLFKQSD